MGSSQDGDRALGVELQIEELVEERQRAVVQNRFVDVPRFDAQIAALYDELAEVAERSSSS
jgi:hypothetical protein